MSTTQYKILTRLFSRQSLIELLNNHSSNIYNDCIDRFLRDADVENKSNRQIIKSLYAIGEKNYRNEYFYKNTILNKILLKLHNINTTIALNEVPIGKSKADFVVINGYATLYEIKSEVDNLNRLNSQLNNYYKAFNKVYVVSYEKNKEKIIKNIKNNKVGIIILGDKNNLKIHREAKVDSSKLINQYIFNILRKSEYESLLLRYYGEIPSSTPVMQYKTCLNLANKMDTMTLYNYALDELRKRNIPHRAQFKKVVPYELKYPIYFSRLAQEEYNRLSNFLTATYGRQ